MCGIAGWLGFPRLTEDEQAGIQSITLHRGPDGEGRFVDGQAGVGLLHRRLSIIDLSNQGRQPMTNEDGNVVLCFNGEIYNFQDLRGALEARGHAFRSKTDSEVLVHGWEEWGQGLLERIEGMYAFAIWDSRARTIFLARDPMGMKPLYYRWDPSGRLEFASEAKAFLAIESFPRRPDLRSLRQYMEFGFVADLEATSLEGLRKLPAGHCLRVSAADVAAGRRPQATRHFAPPPVEPWDGTQRSLDHRADELYEVLSAVVRQHLVADVPIGLLLSGGVDSSIVTALARRHGPVRTLCMGFAVSAVDERPFARRVAEHLGTDHVEVLIGPEEVQADLEGKAYFADDLFGDWGVISTMALYRKCREAGLHVVLVGEGSDELFGGYPNYVSAGGMEAADLGLLRRGLRLYRWFSGQRWGRELLWFLKLVRELDAESGHDPFSTVRLFETRHQLPANYNMKVDKASMAASVEARVPFLDPRVARLGFSTPRELLLHDGTNKYLLRHMAERHGLLPRDVARRVKFGGSIAASWMDDSAGFRAFARDVVLDAGGWTGRLGLKAEMEDYFARGKMGYRFPRANSIFPILAWRLLMLNLWARSYLGGPGGPKVGREAGLAQESPSPEVVPGVVSVIIPVYNREQMLKEAVACAEAQTYRPIEIILVNDGSTDGTADLCDQIAKEKPELVRVVHRANGGPGAARESGRRAARGEFIQYLDSDDWIDPRKLQTQVEALRSRPDAEIAYCRSVETHGKGPAEGASRGLNAEGVESIFPTFLSGRLWHTMTPLYRTTFANRLGPWTDLRQEEDLEYDARAGSLGARLVYSDETLAMVRHHEGERAGGGSLLDPGRMRARCESHKLVYAHAVRAGVSTSDVNMRHYARELFLLARQSGAVGLVSESADLFRLAREATIPERRGGLDFLLYGAAARFLGWDGVGRLARALDGFRRCTSRPDT